MPSYNLALHEWLLNSNFFPFFFQPCSLYCHPSFPVHGKNSFLNMNLRPKHEEEGNYNNTSHEATKNNGLVLYLNQAHAWNNTGLIKVRNLLTNLPAYYLAQFSVLEIGLKMEDWIKNGSVRITYEKEVLYYCSEVNYWRCWLIWAVPWEEERGVIGVADFQDGWGPDCMRSGKLAVGRGKYGIGWKIGRAYLGGWFSGVYFGNWSI